MVAVQDAVATTYTDLQHFIEVQAYRFNQRFPLADKEELMSHANQIFMRAYLTYTPEKGKFTSWLQFLLHKIWLEHVRRAAQRQARLPRVSMELMRCEDKPRRDAEQFLSDLREELSEDARLVVKLVVESPKEFQQYCRHNTVLGIRKALNEFLSALGWSGRRINKTFEEVRGAL